MFVSYALVSATDAVLYTNPSKVTPPVAEHLKEGCVVVRPYDQLVADIKTKASTGTKVAMDLTRVGVGGWQGRQKAARHTGGGGRGGTGVGLGLGVLTRCLQ